MFSVQDQSPQPQGIQGPVHKHAIYLSNGLKFEILSMLPFDTFITSVVANGWVHAPGLFLSYAHIVGIFDETAKPKDDAPSNVTQLRG